VNPDRLIIRSESPDQPDVRALLAALDGYLASLYPAEANHILDVEALLAPEVAFFVARDGTQAVGTAAYRRMPGEPASGGRPYGEVKRMYVDPAFRGRDIGGRLLDRLHRELVGEGYELALLETGGEQVQAVKLYERHGYAPCAAFAGYPDNGLSRFYAKALA
jgi:putative acetyltransferase